MSKATAQKEIEVARFTYEDYVRQAMEESSKTPTDQDRGRLVFLNTEISKLEEIFGSELFCPHCTHTIH